MTGCALVLIGFMGTGKSSAGRAVAERLRLPRYDIDELLMKRFAMPVAAIFAQFGEAAFRDAETEALAQLSGDAPAVVVTGGGILLRPENAEHCRRLGTIAHLTADEETIFQRVSRRPSRPLLQTDNPRLAISELLTQRQSLYRAIADFEIETSHLTHVEVADALTGRWNAFAGAK